MRSQSQTLPSSFWNGKFKLVFPNIIEGGFILQIHARFFVAKVFLKNYLWKKRVKMSCVFIGVFPPRDRCGARHGQTAAAAHVPQTQEHVTNGCSINFNFFLHCTPFTPLN